MMDLTIELDDRLGALADMGAALGRAGISLEGGGVLIVDDFERGQSVSEAWQRPRA